VKSDKPEYDLLESNVVEILNEVVPENEREFQQNEPGPDRKLSKHVVPGIFQDAKKDSIDASAVTSPVSKNGLEETTKVGDMLFDGNDHGTFHLTIKLRAAAFEKLVQEADD
jgi:hypothetical protein